MGSFSIIAGSSGRHSSKAADYFPGIKLLYLNLQSLLYMLKHLVPFIRHTGENSSVFMGHKKRRAALDGGSDLGRSVNACLPGYLCSLGVLPR